MLYRRRSYYRDRGGSPLRRHSKFLHSRDAGGQGLQANSAHDISHKDADYRMRPGVTYSTCVLILPDAIISLTMEQQEELAMPQRCLKAHVYTYHAYL